LTIKSTAIEIECDELGFAKGYVCPKCGSQVILNHEDDTGTKFYKCDNCSHFLTKLKKQESETNTTSSNALTTIKSVDFTCGDCTHYRSRSCILWDSDKIDPDVLFWPGQSPCEGFRLNTSQFFDENGKFVPKILADTIMKKHHFITMMDNQEIYVYLEGFYQPYGEITIKKECKHQLQEFYRKNRVGEVLDYIKTSTFTKRREEPPNLLPLENGVLDINTMELKPYSPDLMFFNKIAVKYNQQATCPKIDKFHSEITNGKEDVTILEEIIGFCLNRDYFIAKALMLVGGGSNGKSTWLSLVKRFLGLQNVSGRSLQDLEEHRFAKADLHTKLANIYADLPDKALHKTGTFKMLTGRDLITAEHKFQRSFHFVNYSKLLFSANKVPEAYDDTNAFFRRWIIIVFPNEFIPGNGADPHILEKITTEEELSGLLNKILIAMRRLKKTGHFSHSKTTEEIREDYIRKSSPIAAFIMDCLEVDSDAFIEKKALYSEFAEYCRGRSLPTVVQDTFFKNLPQHAVVSDFRPRIEGKGRFSSFKGLRYTADGWSNRSRRSRVFYTLIEKSQEYEAPYKIVEIEDKNYIKIELALDRLDRLDQKDSQQNIEDAFVTHCHLCKEHLPNIEEYKRIDGKPVCDKCFKETKTGREGKKQCRHLQKEDEEYACNWGGSLSGLQDESLCGPDCDGWEAS
jgi:P4 family phage/plasmid primase-like protien